jgi:hypothetical protein
MTAGSWHKGSLYFVLVDVRCLRIPPGYTYPKLKTTAVKYGVIIRRESRNTCKFRNTAVRSLLCPKVNK